MGQALQMKMNTSILTPSEKMKPIETYSGVVFCGSCGQNELLRMEWNGQGENSISRDLWVSLALTSRDLPLPTRSLLSFRASGKTGLQTPGTLLVIHKSRA